MTAPSPDEGQHTYLSTACLHGQHDYCSAMTGYQGEKRPATCKFCAAPCVCSCHGGEDTAMPVRYLQTYTADNPPSPDDVAWMQPRPADFKIIGRHIVPNSAGDDD